MSAPASPPTPARSTHKRMPDFFIVGHSKSGTTALYEMLRLHPEIFMPWRKEPMYFARNQRPPGEGGYANPFERTGKQFETLDEYLSLFTPARADQRVGEGSTFYLWSPTAPARIAEAQPAARIIAIFREPASFLHSLHLQMMANHAEPEKDLGKALALEAARREGREIPSYSYWPAALMYSERVRYVEQLRRYHAVFPKEQILVLIYDDFRRDNEGTVRRVMRFLGVDDAAPVEVLDANPTVRVRSVRFDNMLRALIRGPGPVGRRVNATVKALTTPQLRAGVLYPARRRLMFGGPRPPDEKLMIELRHRFKGEVEALSEYLDRDLVTLWGYDKLQ